ncbi:MAG: twin-arginine translocation signal domain-containing protein [Acidobacteriota bacterium]|nr:twin-arginine translocation signal domain-containing protein [Acidobacteriota bacterium]
MKSISRRSFMGHAAAGAAAFAAPAFSAGETNLLYKPGDWQMASFQRLLHQSFEVKQLFDVTKVEDGSALGHMVNSLNGLQFGFGIPASGIKIVGATRGQATVLNFSDYVWEKYRIGETRKINDPKTGKPATNNIYATSAAGNPPKYASSDPNNDGSAFQDISIPALQARGVQFLACHIAMYRAAKATVRDQKLRQTPEEVLQDFTAHLLPGVLVVPSMVSAIAILQSRGQFTYLRV